MTLHTFRSMRIGWWQMSLGNVLHLVRVQSGREHHDLHGNGFLVTSCVIWQPL